MFSMTLTPRFYETDALGHINNAVVSGWFETAREPVFRIFNPQLKLNEWNLILARTEVDFIAQIHYGHEVTLISGIEKVGNTSFTVHHEVWQKNLCVAKGRAVMVFFNYQTQKSESLPASIRTKLETHLLASTPR